MIPSILKNLIVFKAALETFEICAIFDAPEFMFEYRASNFVYLFSRSHEYVFVLRHARCRNYQNPFVIIGEVFELCTILYAPKNRLCLFSSPELSKPAGTLRARQYLSKPASKSSLKSAGYLPSFARTLCTNDVLLKLEQVGTFALYFQKKLCV